MVSKVDEATKKRQQEQRQQEHDKGHYESYQKQYQGNQQLQKQIQCNKGKVSKFKRSSSSLDEDGVISTIYGRPESFRRRCTTHLFGCMNRENKPNTIRLAATNDDKGA
ncbi:hypothetical protein RJ639_026923 [Escallonia herrerae]|uniref:Uncharacterized protein n=1 Tax=Escallonia herrerae TaxID=1293975 RepID=A0AA88X630_9ASTE|nr:hypothetical protein RJ639_026923 [Escallonia herrerae]